MPSDVPPPLGPGLPVLSRPDIPDLHHWVEATDRRLARRIPPRRRICPPRVIEALARLLRSTARPALHGATLIAGACVVALAVRLPASGSAPSTIPTSTSEPLAVQPVVPNADSGPWAAPDITLLPDDDAAALRHARDIEAPDRGLRGVPHGSAPAVPTPDGGGSATAALRPTVR